MTCSGFAQGAVKAIVAMNDAIGLRFMHHEDVAVGMWVSGLNIMHIRQSDEPWSPRCLHRQ